MKFVNFAIVKFAIVLVAGILMAHFWPIRVFLLPYLPLLLALLLFLWLRAGKQLFQDSFFGLATYICFFAIGYASYQMRLPQFQPKHFSNLVVADEPVFLQLKIGQQLKPDKYSDKYIATVTAINQRQSSGKLLLNISKSSLPKALSADDLLLVYAPVQEIPVPLNPYQFDYSTYMKSLGIYGQLRISSKSILHSRDGSKSILGIAQNLRAHIISKLKKTKLKTDERAIIQALVLGEKKDIDQTLYKQYAAAGSVHILAVSGLHVGILYVILTFLLKPLRRWKFGLFTQAIAIVLLLWGFALLSGLSPSVSRAVTMFSFFALAKLFGRETNAMNTLFLSFLTLLIINPLWLFQVGFQLSYLAVFFIVWLQPIFYRVGYSKYYAVRKIWGLITVTLCAQLGVLPLSLYYFHQFPGLFLVTNIVVLPFLTILMCGGILIVLLATFEMLPDWLAIGYNYCIEALNGFVHWVAEQENFLFQAIPFSLWKVMATYLLMATFILMLKKLTYGRLVRSLLAVSLFIGVFILDNFTTSKNQFLVFQKKKQTLLGYKNGADLKLFKSDTLKINRALPPFSTYTVGTQTSIISEEKLPKLFHYNKKRILILDSLGIYPQRGPVHIVLLTQSPKINLERLIDSLQPQQIVADGSNYYSYVQRWENTCKVKKLPFHHTAKQGAFPIE